MKLKLNPNRKPNHPKGYKAIVRRGKWWWEHRYVIHHLLQEQWHPYYGNTIPDGWVVHHLDRNKTNNQPENLCLMSQEFHDSLEISVTSIRRCPYTGKYLPWSEYLSTYGSSAPAWVTSDFIE